MSTLEALLRRLRRLREVLGGPRAGSTARQGDGHPYRVPAARDAPDTWVPAARPPSGAEELREQPDADLERLIETRFPPSFHARHPIQAARLDPPGLLDGWQVIGARRWYWQYQFRCVIVFETDGRRYAYTPERLPASEGERITRLPARTWTGSGPEEEIDLAPVLLRALRRAADAGASQRVRDGVAFLHLLASFTGLGSDALSPPRVIAGDEAAALLDERLDRGARVDVRGALAEGHPLAAAERVVALADHRRVRDGTLNGYDADLALVRLDLGGESLSYAWEIVWSESDEGTDIS